MDRSNILLSVFPNLDQCFKGNCLPLVTSCLFQNFEWCKNSQDKSSLYEVQFSNSQRSVFPPSRRRSCTMCCDGNELLIFPTCEFIQIQQTTESNSTLQIKYQLELQQFYFSQLSSIFFHTFDQAAAVERRHKRLIYCLIKAYITICKQCTIKLGIL